MRVRTWPLPDNQSVSPQVFFRQLLDGLDVQRLFGRFARDNQALSRENSVSFVDVQLVHCLADVIAVVHHAEMLPQDFLAGAQVEAREVGEERRAFFVRQFQFQREFVAVRDAHAQEGVCDDDFGFGSNALAAGGRIFGEALCDGFALEGEGEPALCIFAVGKSRGCHELPAAIGQIRVRVVGRLRVVFGDEVVGEAAWCRIPSARALPQGLLRRGEYTGRSLSWGRLRGSTGACSRGLLCGVAPAGLLPRASAGG